MIPHRMAYFALPTRDNTFLLLTNAAPRLPRSFAVAVSSPSCLVDAAPVRPLRVHSASLFGASVSSKLSPRGWRVFVSVEGNVTVDKPAVSEDAADGEEKAPEVEGVAAGGATDTSALAKKLQRTTRCNGRPVVRSGRSRCRRN